MKEGREAALMEEATTSMEVVLRGGTEYREAASEVVSSMGGYNQGGVDGDGV